MAATAPASRFLAHASCSRFLAHPCAQLYTTSASITRKTFPPFLRPGGPIFQTIDVPRLRAKNQETWPLYNSVTAELTPTSSRAVRVQFRTFRILGFLPVAAPPAAVGALNTTYVDDELRVSRGDKGNLFVLRKADPLARLEDAEFEAPVAFADVFGLTGIRRYK